MIMLAALSYFNESLKSNIMLSKKTKTLVNKTFSCPLIYMLFLFTSFSTSGQCWTTMSTSDTNSGAIKTDGTLWLWGPNQYGQLSESTSTARRKIPFKVGTATNWKSVSIGHYYTVVLKTDGTLWSCGDSSYGQLGLGVPAPTVSLTQIGTATNWKTVSASEGNTSAIKTDGTLWSWGYNGNGALGDGTIVNKSSPVQIGSATNWKLVSNGGAVSAIKTDGTLWSWGYNGHGVIGDGTLVNKSSPVQIGTATNWKSISVGGTHTLAIKTDGTLWGWGENTHGELGDGTLVNKTSPVQIGSETSWQSISAGTDNSMAIKTDGTLWGWGNNAQGQSGQGTSVTSVSIPTLINNSSNNNQLIDSGAIHNLILKTDGSLYGLGWNQAYQLGDNTTNTRFVPTIIICSPLGINDNNTVDFSIYPNPAKDHFTIDCGNSNNVIGYHIEIINTLGQVIFNQPINTQQSTVELNSWSNIGMCFVKIFDAQNNVLTTRKILLQ